MSPSEAMPQHEQPLVTVKDYRPSCHSSSSSDAPDSTDDEFDFEVEKPCPFAHLPKKSRLGRLYITRFANGFWSERPIVTTVETPLKLRCWAINGPDDFYDEQLEREPFSRDDDTIVPMTAMGFLASHRELLRQPPSPKPSVGKISPLQKCYIKIVRPSPVKHRVATPRAKASLEHDVDDMLSTKGRLVEEPCGLSDSSSDSKSQLNFTFNPYTNSSNSTSINFCLRSEEDTSSGESHHQIDDAYEAPLLSVSTGSNLKPPKEQVQTLTHRVEQLMSLANSLQGRITACNREKIQLQQQVQVLQAVQSCSEDSTSPRSSASEPSAETKPKRPSSKTKCVAREEERLRMELLQEKQKTAEVQVENERLLAVILKLKREMDIEHDLHESIKNKAVPEQSGGKWQRIRQLVRSSSGLWDPKELKKRSTLQRGWSFARSKSRKR